MIRRREFLAAAVQTARPGGLPTRRLAKTSEQVSILALGGAHLGRVGGILEAKKIAGMAETHYAQIAPHLYCGPLVGAASRSLTGWMSDRWGGARVTVWVFVAMIAAVSGIVQASAMGSAVPTNGRYARASSRSRATAM